MKYDLDTNVTVRTLKIDDSGYPCTRYINRKGEFDFQNPEMNFVSSGFSANKNPEIIFQTAELKILFSMLDTSGADNLERGGQPVHAADRPVLRDPRPLQDDPGGPDAVPATQHLRLPPRHRGPHRKRVQVS